MRGISANMTEKEKNGKNAREVTSTSAHWMLVFVRGGDSYPKNEDLNYGEFSRLECSAAALFI